MKKSAATISTPETTQANGDVRIRSTVVASSGAAAIVSIVCMATILSRRGSAVNAGLSRAPGGC